MQVYGESNRTGLDLRLNPVSGTLPQPCPTSPPYAICYTSGGPSVTQLVGQVFGLFPLSSVDLSKPAFAGNATRPAGSTRPGS